MLPFIRKHLPITLLPFCIILMFSVASAQENKIAGLYQYSQNEAVIQLYLSPGNRFAMALEYGATNLEIRGKYILKGDSVYLEQDKTEQTFFDIHAAYNPAIPEGKRIVYNYRPEFVNTMFSIGKTYNITTISSPGLNREDNNWSEKDITLNKEDKLWLYTPNNPHMVEEYLLPEKYNELNIVPDLLLINQFKLPRKMKAAFNVQKDLLIELKPGSEALLFKHSTDLLTETERLGLEKPLPMKPLHTKNVSYTTLKVNRQFEDKNTDTLTIIDEELPNTGNQSSKKSGTLEKYDGAFAGHDEATTTAIWFRLERLNFVSKISPKNPAKGEPEEIGVDGTFKLKNDTAYLTSKSTYDEIRLYARENEKIKKGQLKIIFPAAEKSKIRFKSGHNYTSSVNYSKSTDFIKVNDTTLSCTLNKTDSLWVAYTEKGPHIYTYTFDNPLTSPYNEIIIAPGRYKAFNMVECPVYQNKEGQLFLNRNKKSTLQMLPANQQTDMEDFTTPPNDFFRIDNGPIFDELERKGVFIDPGLKK
ncbi:hypothetical protein [Pedobacter cryoconitis]|uniref:Uncharacterized protein n=1 Tax=Pedobacter cryoconitis TaxID=188932 RepID=A0A7X0MKM2_9SPHI|nr:hypothetical protein [Pedobacter cryoconitis]MBB6500598.1 hypothetical protein [Pedobacter cryoconitis]